TVGSVDVDLGDSSARTRIAETAGNSPLTFQASPGNALVRIQGSGLGFVEFDVEAGVVLASDLVLNVESASGDPEFGALRLRHDWSGPRGLIKAGIGVASLT